MSYLSVARQLVAVPQSAARNTSCVVTAIGLVVICGWTFDIGLLKSVLPGAVEMKANTALGFVLCGVVVLLYSEQQTPAIERLTQAFACVVASIGIATLIEYGFALDHGIDELLFRDTVQTFTSARGRMSPYSAAAFAAIGSALVIRQTTLMRRYLQAAAVFVIGMGAATLIGYAWNAGELVTDRLVPPVALNSALASVMTGIAMLLAQAHREEGPTKPALLLADVEIKTLFGYVLTFTVLMFGGGLIYRASVESNGSTDRLASSRHLQTVVTDLSNHWSTSEAAQARYLLTSDRAYLQQFRNAAAQVARDLDELMKPAADPTQQATVTDLHTQLQRRLATLDASVAAFENRNTQSAIGVLADPAETLAYERIHRLIETLSANEQARGDDEGRTAHAQRSILMSLLVTLGAAAIIFVMLFRGLRRATVARDSSEAQLRKSAATIRSILLSSPDCFITLTHDAQIAEVNANGLRLMEIPAVDPLLNKPWLDLWQGQDRISARTAMEAARDQGVGRFEGRCVTIADPLKWWDVIVVPIRGDAGQVERWLAVARDVSEAKGLNAKLVAANRFLDSLIENIPSMIFVKDAETLSFVRVNRTAEALIGYSRNDLIGKSDRDFFPSDEASFFIAKDRTALASGGGVIDIEEEQITTSNQGVRILHTMKLPLFDHAGRAQYLLGISNDITEQKKNEEAIKRLNTELRVNAARLETANHELESFSYSVSHDLRAPLRSIDGFARMLEEDCAHQLDADGRRYLQVIRENSVRKGTLIDDLLALARLGRQSLSKSNVDMNALVAEVLREALATHPSPAPKITVAPLPSAYADRSLIRQVWVNLISNALKYGASAQTPTIGITGAASGDAIVYAIRDNGAGFDMNQYEKLFGAFQRLHSAQEFEGTGVGLAIVERIVSRHAGRVWAQGSVSAGAVFSFSLPTD